jgi:hypothetical protein
MSEKKAKTEPLIITALPEESFDDARREAEASAKAAFDGAIERQQAKVAEASTIINARGRGFARQGSEAFAKANLRHPLQKKLNEALSEMKEGLDDAAAGVVKVNADGKPERLDGAFVNLNSDTEETKAAVDIARAHYRALVSKMHDSWPPFTPEEYKEAFRDSNMIASFNSAYKDCRLCDECGSAFAIVPGANPETARFCSGPCKTLHHNRGREHLDPQQKWAKHRQECPVCRSKKGLSCAPGVALCEAALAASAANAGDALDHANGGESISMAEDRAAHSGMTPRRKGQD